MTALAPGDRRVRIAIVGAGLSGLHAAFLLEQNGISDYVILESRNTAGGRIISVPANDGHARFDLGASWFWPGFQPQLDRLVKDLALEHFAQDETGDMKVEQSLQTAPVRVHGYLNSPPAVRLAGGMAALVKALQATLAPARVCTGQRVRSLHATQQGVALESEDAAGQITVWQAGHVLLALPPRLAEKTITFTPPLPPTLARQWRTTPTWMASHAKYIAIFDRPFWREQGLSGEARSLPGPLGEIHDASAPGGQAALFGFFQMPAAARHRMPEEALKSLCRAQLARLFGPQAAAPVMDILKDWARDPDTATEADQNNAGHLLESPPALPAEGPWSGRLHGIASEWSRPFPGYVAGAIDAATRGVQALLGLDDQTPFSTT